MKLKKNQQNKAKARTNADKIKIKNLISFNNIKNPFKDSKESEKFFKNIIEEEMNLSNTYNSENLNKLLNLYFKGLNLYQNTPNLDKVNAFIEKSQLLLQTPQAKKILNQNKKKKNIEINEIKTDSTLNDENEESEKNEKIENEEKDENNNENKLKYDFKKYKTMKHNEIQIRNRLNYLSNSIKKGIKEKNNQKIRVNEINREFRNIKEQQLKTTIFLEDELKKQENTFKEKLFRKRTIINKAKNAKYKIDIIKEEKNENNENNENNEKILEKNEKNKNVNKIIKKIRNKTPTNSKYIYNKEFDKLNYINKLKRNSFSFFIKKGKDKTINNNNKKDININNNENNNKNDINKNKKENITDDLKQDIYKNINEYNNEIYKYYYLTTMNKISELSKKKYLNNLNIYEGYQINIKELLRKQITCNDKEEENILEDDINSLKEEQDHEIQKNNDLYDKYIDEEISKFKLFGYSKSSVKELDLLKNKIKCNIYNDFYNLLNK
jgi:hypothetical protein